MFKPFRLAAAAVLAVNFLGSTAQAQNWNLHPSYGSVTLNAGFVPDPRTRTVRAGGDQQ